MIILSTNIVIIMYIFIWNHHSYFRLSLLLKFHYSVLIHTYYYILCFYMKTILWLYQLLRIGPTIIGFYAFQSVFVLLFLVAVILSLVFVRETYIYHVYILLTSIFLLIIFNHLILVHIFTPHSILSYYALHHVLSILMTHTSTQIFRRQ